jgi:hypothetical protein
MTPTMSVRIGLIMSLVMLSGCGLNMFAGAKSPVIIDKVGNRVGTLSFTNDRRVVLVRLQESSGSEAGRFCAEPPHDADQKVTGALAAMRNLSMEKIDANLQEELTRSFAQNFPAFIRRTQGLQLYREAMYNLCQNYLNHAIKEDALQAQSNKIFELSVKLIERELALTQGIAGEPSLRTSAESQKKFRESFRILRSRQNNAALTP